MASRQSTRTRKVINYAGLDVEVDTERTETVRPTKRRKLFKDQDFELDDASDREENVGAQSSGIFTPHCSLIHGSEGIAPCLEGLLEWYDGVKHSRGMPWRRDYDPDASADGKAQRAYEVLVSEIMLQQTQVATVIPYYNAWLVRFPTIKDLAAVEDIEEVNRLWKGLGYYRRASNLLKGAKKVVDDFDGRIPADVKVLEKDVSGVGRYTAGAVCSIAYNVKAPAVDGNVIRLFSRLLAVHASNKSKAMLDVIWDAASTLVDTTNRPGDLNQAFIELGSTICKPVSPLCGQCPLQKGCTAYALATKTTTVETVPDLEDLCNVCEPFPAAGTAVTRFPFKVKKKGPRVEASVVTVVRLGPPALRMLLMSQRPAKGLLAGLWEFPTTDLEEEATLPAQLEASRSVVATVDPDLTEEDYAPVALGSFLHLFSHIRKTYHVVCVDLPDHEVPSKAWQNAKWVKQADFQSINVGKGSEKVWEMISSQK